MANQNPAGSATAVLANATPNTAYTIYESHLLEGFYDPDGDTLKVASLWSDNGEVIESGNGQWLYTPEKDANNLATTLYYVVSDFNGGDLQTSLSFNVLSNQTPPTGQVTISGIAQPNQILTASNNLADVNGLGIISYQWLSNGTAINGANQSNYIVQATDAGKSLSVTASYTDGLGKLESVSSNAVTPSYGQVPPTGTVTISGIAQPNQILTASNNLADVNGLGIISYQWFFNGSMINGATQSTYTLQTNDIDKEISVSASYTDGLGKLESVSSAEVIINPLPEPIYTLSIDKDNVNEGGKVKLTLTTKHIEPNTEIDFEIEGSLSQNDVKESIDTAFIIGSDGKASLTWTMLADKLTEDEEDLTLTLVDDANQSVGFTVNDTSLTPKQKNNKPTGNVTIQGNNFEGETLAIKNTLKDKDGLGEFSYQWLKNGKTIEGANTDIYAISSDDVGQKISIKVSYVDGMGNRESKTSSPTKAIVGEVFDLEKKGDNKANKIIGSDKNDRLTGLAGNDTLRGNAGNDLLEGGDGKDSLEGGNGNDRLLAGAGNDTLLGGSGDDLLDGNDGNDKLVGDAGNDTLKGGIGSDDMTGGDGNDYYVVDDTKDKITETNKNTKTGGIDTIETTLNYTLPKNIENLVLKDSQGKGLKGTGNELNNDITGSIGDDSLNGMAGNDQLTGSNGEDTLDGGKGMDTLIGGAGNDTYFMNNDNDEIIEEADGGEQDVVMSSVTFDLTQSEFIEVLILDVKKDADGIGNDLDNLIREKEGGTTNNELQGGDGNDELIGEGGNDTLEGGAGNDILDGGDGKDIAVFSGAMDDYQITRNIDADGVDQIIVEYVGNDAIFDGMDSLLNIETLIFADDETLNTRDIESVDDSNEMIVLTGLLA